MKVQTLFNVSQNIELTKIVAIDTLHNLLIKAFQEITHLIVLLANNPKRKGIWLKLYKAITNSKNL